MKKLFLFLLISIPLITVAQDYPGKHHPPALYISHQPVDFGVGVRIDYYVNGLGLYNSISYSDWGLYRQNDLRHHVKLSMGVLLPLSDYNGAHFDVTAAINYHYLSSAMIEGAPVNPKILNPFSFELGVTIKMRRFACGMRTDILRKEPCVDFGLTF